MPSLRPHGLRQSQTWATKIFTLLLLIITFASVSENTTISVTSGSIYVGALTQYTIQVSGYSTNPTSIIMGFDQWSPTTEKPYLSNYTVLLTSGSTYSNSLLSCSLAFTTMIRCLLPAGLSSTSSLQITNIHNPSSTKPYSMSFFVNSQNISASLTVTTLQVSNLIETNFDYKVGAVSQSILYF